MQSGSHLTSYFRLYVHAGSQAFFPSPLNLPIGRFDRIEELHPYAHCPTHTRAPVIVLWLSKLKPSVLYQASSDRVVWITGLSASKNRSVLKAAQGRQEARLAKKEKSTHGKGRVSQVQTPCIKCITYFYSSSFYNTNQRFSTLKASMGQDF